MTLGIDGRPAMSETDLARAQDVTVTPGYFEALRIPVLQGRTFTRADNAGGDPVAIRLALGADPRQVRWLVVADGMRMVVAGAALGLAAGIGVARLMASILYTVKPLDPIALLASLGLLGLVGLISCWLPARQASGVDPAITLRSE